MVQLTSACPRIIFTGRYSANFFWFFPRSSKMLFCFRPTFLFPISRFFGWISRKTWKIVGVFDKFQEKIKICYQILAKNCQFLQNIYTWLDFIQGPWSANTLILSICDFHKDSLKLFKLTQWIICRMLKLSHIMPEEREREQWW